VDCQTAGLLVGWNIPFCYVNSENGKQDTSFTTIFEKNVILFRVHTFRLWNYKPLSGIDNNMWRKNTDIQHIFTPTEISVF